MPKCILAEQGGKGSGSSVTLQKIEVTTPPNDTDYLAGETFNSEGMVITASYGLSENVIITTAEVTGYKVSPTPLTDGITYVTISYSEMGVTRSTTQEVHVTHRLTAINITQEPSLLTYEYGDTLQIAGMVV